MRRVDALLGTCARGTLRRRRSFKWRTYPPDVLPAFVAEMDFGLARPVIDARAAILAVRATASRG
jgi:bifunctional pyridoxal-dependent enzyme with beta-cystathionase and maltose regulon repressor activities